ncbi:MAG: ComEC/Rec2 family competence protein [Patescibacteria group bacterium]
MPLADKVLFFCLTFISGIVIASFFKINIFLIYIFFLVATVVAIFVFLNILKINKRNILFFITILIIGLIIGVLRFDISKPGDNSVAALNEDKIIFIGTVDEAPLSKINKQTMVLNLIEIYNKKYVDKVLVTTELYPRYEFNQKLKISCELKKPGKFENFDYGEYLANSGIYMLCYYPKIEILGYAEKKNIKEFFINLKFKQVDLINTNLSPPYSSLLSAIILGEKSELDNSTREIFSKAGISHIVAISGMHIAIISLIFFYFFLYLGFSRQKSFKYIFIILIFYLLLIGFKASAIRAVIMGLIVMYGLKEGRLSSSGRAIIFAATFLLLLNPRLLRFDVGFQLSFLATIGIIYFYPFINKWIKIISEKIRGIISITLSAQVLTLPLVFYYFGIVSFISPITNVLVLPILPFLMVFGLLFVSIGFIWQPIATFLGILIWIVLEVIIKISEILTSFGLLYLIYD